MRILTLFASGVVACSSSSPSSGPEDASDGEVPSDAGNTIDSSDAGNTMDGPDVGPAMDGGDAAPPDATTTPDGPGTVEGGPLDRPSLRLASGSQIVAVTSDEFVVYWASSGSGAGPALTAIPAAGGAPQVLSTAASIGSAVVAGTTAVWSEPIACASGACVGVVIRSWSAAHGVLQIDPSASGGDIGVTSGYPYAARPGSEYQIAVNADGSKVAYTSSVAPGTFKSRTVALASTDGATPPVIASLTTPLPAFFYVNGNVMTLMPGSPDLGPLEVFAGNPLAVTIPALLRRITDPNGELAWEPATTGMELVRTSDGSVVFTDPSALDVAPSFDAVGTFLFYSTTAGVKQVALTAPTPVMEVLTGSDFGVPIQAAPNGGAVLCKTASDAGAAFHVVTTGPMPKTFEIPATPTVAEAAFLPDSTLAWHSGEDLFAEPTLGGTVSRIATSVHTFAVIGMSQIVTFPVDPSSPVVIVDARTVLPTVVLDPTPDTQKVFAPPAGGIVAYTSGGAIYSARTR